MNKISKEEFTQKILELQKLKQIEKEKKKDMEYENYIASKKLARRRK